MFLRILFLILFGNSLNVQEKKAGRAKFIGWISRPFWSVTVADLWPPDFSATLPFSFWKILVKRVKIHWMVLFDISEVHCKVIFDRYVCIKILVRGELSAMQWSVIRWVRAKVLVQSNEVCWGVGVVHPFFISTINYQVTLNRHLMVLATYNWLRGNILTDPTCNYGF